MNENCRPWWAPGIKGFLAIYALTGCMVIVLTRMFLPLLYTENKVPDDKVLDIMTGVLFVTCLAGAFNYFFGSSQRTMEQEAAQTKLVDKVLTAPAVSTITPEEKK